jgi:signal transduction histidine kinase
MPSCRAHAPLAHRLALALVLVLLLVDIAWATTRHKQVLVLYATRRDAQIAVVGDRELPQIIEEGLAERVDYYSEFIDQSRFPGVAYLDAFRDFLALKYGDRRFDVVVAMGDVPLAFVAINRALLFADVPVVYFASQPPPRKLENATGVIALLDLVDTVALATTLQPETRHLFVISGNGGGNEVYERVAREQFRPFEPRLKITYLSGLPTRDLEKRLAALPDHSIVYYLVVDRDGANEYFHPLEYLDRITTLANAPTYCWVDSALDHGIVGGSLKDQGAQTRAVGQLVLRVLGGERPDSIPPSSLNLNVRQVDWGQLRRWRISRARVPAGVRILNEPFSVWSRYRTYILGALGLLIVQTALIAGLLVQRTRRRLAEASARSSQAALRVSYGRIRDLGARLLNAQETERSRIARELHDDIGQRIALLTMDLELQKDLEAQGRGQAHKDVVGTALVRAHSIAKSLHDLSHRVHPATLRFIGLLPALQALERELSQSEMTISVTHENVPTLSDELTVGLFRIVQEALMNAVKHSGAREVSVHLRGEADSLSVMVTDDGVGFDVDGAWGAGLGLISINERLEAIGGRLDIESAVGAGTRLEVTVPIPAACRQEVATG